MHSSSTRAKVSRSINPLSSFERAYFQRAVRRRLPTTSVRMMSSLFTFDSCLFDCSGVASEILAHEAMIVLGAVFPQLHAECRHALCERRLAHDLRHGGLQPGDHPRRRAGTRLQADHGGDAEAGEALLGRRRHLWGARRAPRRAYGEGVWPARAPVRVNAWRY